MGSARAIGMTHPSSSSSVTAGDGAEEESSEAEDAPMSKSPLVLTPESLADHWESVEKFSKPLKGSVVVEIVMQCGAAAPVGCCALPCDDDGEGGGEASESECLRMRSNSLPDE
jgi:hypothetical protein